MSSIEPGAASQVFQPPRPLAGVAAETAALLREARVQLAIAEAGTGEVTRLLRAAVGQDVLTGTRLFETAEELAVALRVSSAKVAAFGAISAMVAAEAAADLIDTYEGGWGLVVMLPAGNREGQASVQSTDAAPADGYVALGTPSATIIEQSGPAFITRIALELLGEQARRRLKHRT